jgi:hypothetical protein
MKFKEFIAPSRQKIILFIFLIFFGSIPFILPFFIIFSPPIISLMSIFHSLFVPSYAFNSSEIFFTLMIFLVQVFSAYLISCFVNWIIKKITPASSDRTQLIIIWLISISLFALSFLNIYGGGGPGGGNGTGNIIDLIRSSFRF